MKIQKQILFCVITSFSMIMLASLSQHKTSKLPPVKQITIIAQRDFLHDHDSRCLIKVNPLGTIVTPNDMDSNGFIILDENRNSAIFHIAQPADGIIHLSTNFECNCFTTHYTITYDQLADKNNVIHLDDDFTEISKRLVGKNSHKPACSKNKQRIAIASEDVRPGAVITPADSPKMTIEDILRKHQDSRHILKALKEQGYNQSNLTQKNLELPGKLSKAQIEYIMERLPLDKNVLV